MNIYVFATKFFQVIIYSEKNSHKHQNHFPLEGKSRVRCRISGLGTVRYCPPSLPSIGRILWRIIYEWGQWQGQIGCGKGAAKGIAKRKKFGFYAVFMSKMFIRETLFYDYRINSLSEFLYNRWRWWVSPFVFTVHGGHVKRILSGKV